MPATRRAAAAAAASTAAAQPPPLYSVIVPTYNEVENLPLVAWLVDEACAGAGLDYELVVVDDASPDGTAAAAAALAALPLFKNRLRVVRRAGKLGLGSAYGAGLAAARGDWVVLMDADLSHHPRYIPDLVATAAATGADVVASSRYLRGGGGVAGWSLGRKLTSRGANVLAATLLGAAPLSDLTGAFRLYRRALLERLLPAVRSGGYAFQMEVLVRAQAAGAAIAELPIVFVDRVYGDSKLGPAEFAMFAAGLARLMVTL